MSIYAISDLHLSFDKRIDKPMDKFGSEWHNHAERLKENWLELVGENDTVLIPGDISWGLSLDEAMADLRWISELPGHKIITKGNHDLWWITDNKLKGHFDESNITFLKNRCIKVCGTDTYVCGSRGWVCPGFDGFTRHDEKIYKRELIRLELSLDDAKRAGAKDIIAMLHYPPTNDKLQPSGFTDLMSKYNVKTCIFGHLHGTAFNHGIRGILNGVDYHLVSIDYLKCKPILIR